MQISNMFLYFNCNLSVCNLYTYNPIINSKANSIGSLDQQYPQFNWYIAHIPPKKRDIVDIAITVMIRILKYIKLLFNVWLYSSSDI